MTTDGTTERTFPCKHHPDVSCHLEDGCDPMCWTYVTHWRKPAAQGYVLDEDGLTNPATGAGIRYAPKPEPPKNSNSYRREANLELLQKGLKWRMSSKGFTCCQCKRAIPEHTTYAALHYYNAGLSAVTHPDRLHEGCVDSYLEKLVAREREHLEALAEITERERG